MKREITVLGAYGTKGKDCETSSFQINQHHVIDAGNLLRSLNSDSAKIEAVWLTHSHLDHIVDIAYILDSYFSERSTPLKLMGLPQTLDAVRTHFLNDVIWPDFSRIKLNGSDMASVEYHPIQLGECYRIGDKTSIEPFKTDHTIESCGFIVKEDGASILITADTYDLESVVNLAKERKDIRSLVIECSFPNAMRQLAIESKHLTPELLFEQLEQLDPNAYNLYVNHIKPLYETKILEEISENKGLWNAYVLKDGDKIQF